MVALDDDLYDVPQEFRDIDLDIDEQTDWYNILLNKNFVLEGGGAPTIDPEHCVRCVLRTDGRIGFRFSKTGWTVFVIKLTDFAKHLFGFSEDFVAIDDTEQFGTYLDNAVLTQVQLDVPNSDEAYECIFDNCLFTHEKYRHEIVVLTTLPVSNYIDCETTHATFQSQLCSYRYPPSHLDEKFVHTSYREISETRDTNFIFEHANRTHNEFLVSGTQLQNFHIKLVLRTYVYNSDTKSFERNETNYPLEDDSFWTITLNVRDV